MSQAVAFAAESSVSRLARFFPAAIATRIPVRLKALSSRAGSSEQQVVIDFGTASEVLFECSLLLELGDEVHLLNADGSFDACAVVVAVQVEQEKKAIAVRFNQQMPNWIIKP